MSSESRNLLLSFLLSYHVWVTSKIQVNFRLERYWWFCLIHFGNFHTIHVFEVRESIADVSTELPCSSYFENLGQLLVPGYLKCTDDCILWILTISSLFMFSRSRNPLLTFLLSYDVWVTSKIQVNSRFEKYWWFWLINFWNFHTIHGHVTPRHVTLCHVMSRHATSCHVMSRHVTSCHVMSCHVMSRHVTSCHVMSRHVTSCQSCHVMSRHVTSKVVGRSHDQSFIVNWLFPQANNSN